jgi:transposase
MNETINSVERVIGLDAHPDSFTAVILRGTTPANAVQEKMFNKVPMERLLSWANKNTTLQDHFVLEASGNSFHIARLLEGSGRIVSVMESGYAGKLKEAHANNDAISAVRIGKAFLSGTAKTVWVPDLKTQERRDVFHAYIKTVKRTTQIQNRLDSYLSDKGVRLKREMKGTSNAELKETIRNAKTWESRQWQIIESMLLELSHAQEQEKQWHSLIAQEVIEDPSLLELTRVCGVREIVAFALGSFIGDISRFAKPGSLVKYIGLNPAFDDSGKEKWSGGGGGHGHKELRRLLVESAHAVLRTQTPIGLWGRKLLGRKSAVNLAVAAVARKLVVSIWYLMKGQWPPVDAIDKRTEVKTGKIISQVGDRRLKEAGKTRKTLREEIYARLKTVKVYQLKPVGKPTPKPCQGGPVKSRAPVKPER